MPTEPNRAKRSRGRPVRPALETIPDTPENCQGRWEVGPLGLLTFSDSVLANCQAKMSP